MDCIGPVTPELSDFLAYADNAASVSIREHIAACRACRERAFLLRREQRSLQGLLHRAGCPPALTLGEHHLGLLNDQHAAEVAEHLRLCPACRKELGDLAAFMQHLRQPVADAVGVVLGSLRTLVAQQVGPGAGGGGPDFAPALRALPHSSEAAPAMYSALDVLVTVDSWIERMGLPGRAVAGLVAGPVDFTGAAASMDEGELGAATQIDELGNFLFSAVAPGTHHLVIRLPAEGVQIQIDELIVK